MARQLLEGLIIGIDHVAVCVPDMDAGAGLWTELLGLPLARRVIESHGGAIHALSAGGWTTFVVTLPFDPHGGMEENR